MTRRKPLDHTSADWSVFGMTIKTSVTLATPFGNITEPSGGAVEWLCLELKRLRDLIRDAEANGSADRCPWCNAWVQCAKEDNAEERHYPDCGAFTGSGEVR